MLLTAIFSILLVSILFLFFIPKTNFFLLRQVALISSGLVLFLSSFLLITFNCNIYFFQHIVTCNLGFNFLNIYFLLGLDGISLFFFILSSFLIFLCIIFIWNEPLFKEYAIQETGNPA